MSSISLQSEKKNIHIGEREIYSPDSSWLAESHRLLKGQVLKRVTSSVHLIGRKTYELFESWRQYLVDHQV